MEMKVEITPETMQEIRKQMHEDFNAIAEKYGYRCISEVKLKSSTFYLQETSLKF